MLEAIRLIQRELAGRVPLIGFAGAPFTLASYAIEGGHSNNFARTKALMYGHPDAWHRLCDAARDRRRRLPGRADRRRRRRRAGVRLVGRRAERRRLPRVRAAAHAAHLRGDRPAACRRFTSAPARPRSSRSCARRAATSIGVDWRIPIDDAWERIGHDRAVQGNLDPTLLLGPVHADVQRRPTTSSRASAGAPGHIFNLGHGILPSTPVEHVQMLAQYVHSASRRRERLTVASVRTG